MSDLDTELAKILKSYVGKKPDKYFMFIEQDIAQIKQAFAEAGYEKFVGGRKWGGYETPNGELVSLMSGPEWYEQFVLAVHDLTPTLPFKEDFFRAAKRASGVKQ